MTSGLPWFSSFLEPLTVEGLGLDRASNKGHGSTYGRPLRG